MNRIYKVIWSPLKQVWVVAGELARSHKKSRAVMMACATGLPLLSTLPVQADPPSRALPVLTAIASGSATVSSTTGNMTINQSTDKLIANWTSFEVGVLSKVTFTQPATTSIALNRITTAAPSQVFGKVLANGRLILVNPAGLTFGPSSQVNASSIIVSTLNMTDANFNSGNLQFDRGASTGVIDNKGIIMSTDGNTFVFAPTIKNSGTTRAKAGNVNLANGNRLIADQSTGTTTLSQVSGIAGIIQSSGVLRGDRLTTTDKGKLFIVGDRARAASMVNLAGDITSTGIDVKARTLNVTGDLLVNSNTSLNATNSINIDGALNVDGNNRLISLAYGTTGSDNLYFGENGKINMPGNTIRFRDNGVFYPLIKTLAEFQAIGSNATTLGGQYVLAADIDLTGVAFTPFGSSASSMPFTGYLDGLGHWISNLTLNRPAADDVGLISFARFATIKHVNVHNASVTGQNYVGGLIGRNGSDNGTTGASLLFNNRVSGNVTGRLYVGGLVGQDSMYNLGTSTINANHNAAVVSGRYYMGGLVGYSSINNANLVMSNNTVSGNTQASSINEDKSDIGGLVGHLDDYYGSAVTMQGNLVSGNVSSTRNTSSLGGGIGVLNIYNSTANIQSNITGNVSANINSSYAGGLIGYQNMYGTSSSTIQGDTSGSVSAGAYVGGLIGYAYNGASGTVSNSNTSGNVSGAYYVGGLIGQNNGNSIVNSHASGDISASGTAGGLIGQNNGASVSDSDATGDVIATTTSGYLGGLIGYNSSPSFSVNNSYATGMVNGIVSGSGASSVGGLIGYNNGAMINDSHATGAVSGSTSVGGLVGYNGTSSNIQNSYASGNVQAIYSYAGGLIGYNDSSSVSDSHASGVITLGSSDGGGLIGINYLSPVNRSYATGAVQAASATTPSRLGGLIGTQYSYSGTLIMDSNFATGNVTGGDSQGGLFGYVSNYNDAILKITNSYAKGNVTGSSYYVGGLLGQVYDGSGKFYLTNTYANGAVSGFDPAYTGGLIGYVFDGSTGISFITNNYWDKTISGQNVGIGSASTLNRSVTNLTGLTTAQSRQLSSYTGWDISSAATGSSSIWYINNGVATPVLRSLMAAP